MEKDIYECIVEFEKKYHEDLADWVISKTSLENKICAFLDISDDFGTFANLVSEKSNCDSIISIKRDWQEPPSDAPKTIRFRPIDLNNLSALSKLGQFDLIILKEVLHEVDELVDFFKAIIPCLKDPKTGRIFLITRPKNPPLPLPDEATEGWAKVALSRDAILGAVHEAGLALEGFSASCPIRMPAAEWGRLLSARLLPAVRAAGEKCSDARIQEFVRSKGAKPMVFEEKLLMFSLWLPQAPAATK